MISSSISHPTRATRAWLRRAGPLTPRIVALAVAALAGLAGTAFELAPGALEGGGHAQVPLASQARDGWKGVGGSAGSGPTLYNITFTETGLLTNASWSVLLGGVDRTSQDFWIYFNEPNGSFGFTVSGPDGWSASPSSGTVLISGQAASWYIYFTQAPPSTYDVNFTEAGLPTGTSWSVTLAGTPQASTTSEITFSEEPGTYQYTVATAGGRVPTPSSGQLSVASSAVYVSVAFSSSSSYSVVFSEIGLNSGTLWSVDLGGSTEQSSVQNISFSEQNGTYTFSVGRIGTYQATPSSGAVRVAGTPVVEAIGFSPKIFDLNFTESGLPSGGWWEVNLSGDAEASSSTTITFQTRSGPTYSYDVVGDSGYTAATAAGEVTVNGSAVSVPLEFLAPGIFSVTFLARALPGGILWTVTVAGTSKSSASAFESAQQFDETNGTYPFTASGGTSYAPNGSTVYWVASPSSGSVSVAGSAVDKSVYFNSTFKSPPAGSSGSPGPWWQQWLPSPTVLVAAALGVVVILAAVLWARRRKDEETAPDPLLAGKTGKRPSAERGGASPTGEAGAPQESSPPKSPEAPPKGGGSSVE